MYLHQMQVLSSCMNNKIQTHKPLQSITTCQVKPTCYMNPMHANACSKNNASMKEETICTINMTALATHIAPCQYHAWHHQAPLKLGMIFCLGEISLPAWVHVHIYMNHCKMKKQSFLSYMDMTLPFFHLCFYACQITGHAMV